MSLHNITNQTVTTIILSPKEEEIKRPVTKKVEKVITPVMKALSYFKKNKAQLEKFLMQACREGTITKVKLALLAGADVNKPNSNLERPLHNTQSIQIAKLLIDHGADINAKDYRGNSPLHYAESVALAKLLIDHGADINAKDYSGNSPLHLVEKVEIATLLIEAGGEINISNIRNETPLFRILIYGYEKLGRFLIKKGAKVNIVNSQNKTLLHMGLSCSFKKLLVSLGANIHAKDSEGNTPLFFASDIETASFLINAGSKVNITNNEGNSPIHKANSIKLVELLINNGATIDKKNHKGQTPLHTLHNEDIILYLIKKGANINIYDNQGNTLLHRAVFDRLLKIILFFNSSKYSQIKNNNGKTALDLAITIGDINTVSILENWPHLLKNIAVNNHLSPEKSLVIEYKNSRIISHIFNLHSVDKQDDSLESLDGTNGNWLFYIIAKGLINYRKKFSHSLSDLKLKKIINSLKIASKNFSAKKIKKMIANNELCFVSSGWINHHITLVFHGDYMAICNRGEGSQQGVIKVFKIDPKKLDIQIIKKILTNSEENFEHGSHFLYKTLPSKLSPNPHGPIQDMFCKAWENAELKVQTWGNCSFANKKAAVYFAYVISLFDKKSDFNSSRSVLSKMKKGRYDYKIFSDSMAIKYFEKIKNEKFEKLFNDKTQKLIWKFANSHMKRKQMRLEKSLQKKQTTQKVHILSPMENDIDNKLDFLSSTDNPVHTDDESSFIGTDDESYNFSSSHKPVHTDDESSFIQ